MMKRRIKLIYTFSMQDLFSFKKNYNFFRFFGRKNFTSKKFGENVHIIIIKYLLVRIFYI